MTPPPHSIEGSLRLFHGARVVTLREPDPRGLPRGDLHAGSELDLWEAKRSSGPETQIGLGVTGDGR